MPHIENLLLKGLDRADLLALLSSLELIVQLPGTVIARQGEPVDFAYFPESGVTTIVTAGGAIARPVSMLIGREGFLGWPALLGATHWPNDVVACFGSTRSWRIAAGTLNAACRGKPHLLERLLAFVAVVLMQIERSVVTGPLHSAERRMARWLLLYHDRLDGEEIRITHEELAVMLGIRRASATDVMHLLEGRQLVWNRRGRVIIRDRASLETFAGDAYGAAEAEYRRCIGPFGKSVALVAPLPAQRI